MEGPHECRPKFYDMNHFPDNSSDSDFDGGELAWNEHDWRNYLNKNDSDIARFSKLYFENIGRADRLDTVAHLMRWDKNDWLLSEGETSEPSIESKENYEPYTLHCQPVFIVTRALYQKLHAWTIEYMGARPAEAVALHVLSRTFDEGHYNACMAYAALDIGEYILAICHLKQAMSHINNSLGVLHELPPNSFAPNAHTLLFDLRELCLRVIADCREENLRRLNGEND